MAGSEASMEGRTPFEHLTREEMVLKIKGLLGIAQRAKLAKDEISAENKALKELVENLTADKLSAANQIDDLKRKLKQTVFIAEQTKSDQEKLVGETDSLKRDIHRLVAENEGLIRDLSELERKLIQDSQTAAKLGAKKSSTEENLRREVEELTQELKSLKIVQKDQLNCAQLKIQRLEQYLSAKDEEIKRISESLTGLQREEDVEVEKFEKDEHIVALEESLNEKCKEVERLAGTLSQKESEIDRWQTLINTKETDLVEKDAEIESLNKELITVRDQFVSLENKIKEIQKSNEIEIAKNKSELIKSQDLNINLVEKVEYLETELESKLNAKQNEENVALQAEIDRLQCLLNDNENKLSTSQAELDNTKVELINLQHNIEQLQSELQLEKKRRETELSDISERHLQYVEQLEKRIGQAQHREMEIQNELSQTKEQLTLSKSGWEESVNQIEINYKNQIVEISSKLEATAMELALSKEKLCSIEKISEACNTTLRDLQIEFNRASDEVSSLKAGNNDKDNIIASISTELHQKQEIVDAQLQTIEEFEKTLQEVTAKHNEQLAAMKKELESNLVDFSETKRKLEMTEKALESNNLEQNKSVSDQIQSLKNTIESKNQIIETMQQTMEKSKCQHKDMICNMQNDLDRITEQLTREQENVQRLLSEQDLGWQKTNEIEEKFNLCKNENRELLTELQELNQVLKERGEVISMQLDKISKLEQKNDATSSSLKSKIADLEDQINVLTLNNEEKDKIIRDLQEEINSTKEKVANIEISGDQLSVSTVSKAEEGLRLKEIDDSFDEKYHKLRFLAAKLKKKVSEQNDYISKLEQTNADNNVDLLQKIKEFEDENKKYKDIIQSQENEIKALRQSEKSTKEHLPSDYQQQIQALKLEKEAFNLAKKDLENEVKKLRDTLQSKEKELSVEVQNQNILKGEINKLKAIAKKSNVLNLEMEHYEKSLKELNQRLESKKSEVDELINASLLKDDSITKLNKEIVSLKKSLETENALSSEKQSRILELQRCLKTLEEEKSSASEAMLQLQNSYDKVRTDLENERLQLTDAIEKSKSTISILESDNANLSKKFTQAEEAIQNLTDRLQTREKELALVQSEFDQYKVRAKSVLRQNQGKELNREKELEEELSVSQTRVSLLESKLKTLSDEIEESKRARFELKEDKERIQVRCKELLDLLEDVRSQNDVLNEGTRKFHQEQKDLQRQIDTMRTCYEKDLSEMLLKHEDETKSLKATIADLEECIARQEGLLSAREDDGATAKTDEQKINMKLLQRGEGEGSENNQAALQPVTHRKPPNRLIPLDELLSSSFEEPPVEEPSYSSPVELQRVKENLVVQESRVKHLSILLAEAEADLAKMTQLNEVLKEEVRRQHRAIEREEHIHNSEYLKNVIVKFLTLNSIDEKLRLIPVMSTILKLSPEEAKNIQISIKGTEVSLARLLPWSSN